MTETGFIETIVGAFLLYMVIHIVTILDQITQIVTVGELYTILLLTGLCLAYGGVTFVDGINLIIDNVIDYFNRSNPI